MPEQPLSDTNVYGARPTIRVDGQEVAAIAANVVALEVREQHGGLSNLMLRVLNISSNEDGSADLTFEDDRVLRLGGEIAVYAGDVATPREIFRGKMTALEIEFSHEGPPELVVLAEDVFQRARMQRRTKLHSDVTLKQIAEDLASSISFRPVVTGLDDNIGTHLQLNESDLAFLRRLLDEYDADLQAVGDELHVSPRKDVDRGEVELALFSQLSKVRIVADLADQVTAISVAGWDAAQGSRVSGSSSGSNLGPGSGRTGAQILRDAIGERTEHLGHLPIADDAEARAWADGAFDQAARRFVRVYGTCEGNPQLRVGARAKLTGISGRFDNTYYVVAVTHRFDIEQGYQTEFEAESAYLGNP